MPGRFLREGILDSEKVDVLSAPEEVFYRRLMSAVDDFGRFDGRPAILKSRLYPLRSDKVREADISLWIAACVKAGLIALYHVDGKQYLLFERLGEARAKSSKFPAPPTDVEARFADACKRTQAHTDAPPTVPVPSTVPSTTTTAATAAIAAFVLPSELDFEEFRTAWDEWQQHRKQKRDSLTPTTAKRQLSMLAKLGKERATAMILHTITMGWTGLREQEAATNRNGKPEVKDFDAESRRERGRKAVESLASPEESEKAAKILRERLGKTP